MITSNSVAPPLASLRRRLASMFYEAILLVALLSAVFLLPLAVLGVFTGAAPPGGLLWLYVFMVLAGYYVWHWRRGQTLAMRTWKLGLRSATGQMPSFRQSVLRYLFAWPSLGCCGAGIVWAIFDRDRQFLHDRLAGTRIVASD